MTSCVPPSLIVAASMLPTAAGAGGSTVTAKDCSALPAVFVAVTVTVALPAPTAVTVTAAPFDLDRRHRVVRGLRPVRDALPLEVVRGDHIVRPALG